MKTPNPTRAPIHCNRAGAARLFASLIRAAGLILAAATIAVVSARATTYDFLPVTITGPGGQFTSPNGNGFITVTNTGGPFLGLNNTMYPGTYPNLFPASGTVQGWLAQADNNATYTNTFYLANYALTPQTVFGMWNITEDYEGTYHIEVYDSANNLIAPPFNWKFMGYDDNASDGNIGWHHMV